MTAKQFYELYKNAHNNKTQIPKRIREMIELKQIIDCEGLSEVEGKIDELVSGEIIIISGDAGCGKTVSSIYAGLRYSSKTSWIFYFLTSREYLKAQFNGGSYYDKELNEDIQPEGVENLLIIDDLGREYFKDTGWGIDQWDSFFDKRYRDKLPTIITTNMTPEELVEKYNERILDRLRECGTWIGLSGKSQRKKKK